MKCFSCMRLSSLLLFGSVLEVGFLLPCWPLNVSFEKKSYLSFVCVVFFPLNLRVGLLCVFVVVVAVVLFCVCF